MSVKLHSNTHVRVNADFKFYILEKVENISVPIFI